MAEPGSMGAWRATCCVAVVIAAAASAACGPSQGRAHPSPAILIAFDADSGAQRWALDTLPARVTTISAHGERVVLDGQSDCAGADQSVAVVGAADGRSIWTARLNPSYASNGPRSLAVPVIVVSTDPKQTKGLSLATGDVVWTAPLFDHHTVDDGQTVYVQSLKSVVALSLATGAVTWKVPFDGGAGEAVVIRRVIVMNTLDRVWALDVATGRPRWQHSIGEGFVTLAAEGSTVIVQVLSTGTAPGSLSTLTALDARTGSQVWQRTIADVIQRTFAAPQHPIPMATSRGRLFLPVDDRLFALDVASGRTRWTAAPSTPGDGITSLAADGSRLVVGTGHSIEVLDPLRGEVRWHHAARDVTAVAAGPLVYAATAGKLAHCTPD